MKRIFSIFCILTCLMFAACSETKNLAEDETLYVGIKELAYDREYKAKQKDKDSTGVITAVANAYNIVSGLFTGNASAAEALKALQKENLTKQQKDSVKAIITKDTEAYNEAKTEVTGALSYAPNNSFMGSSSMRHPLAIGLWVYNKYVYSDKRFGKWMFNNFAATPRYITTANPRVRAQVAQNTLRNFGYFRGRVSYELVPQKNPKKAKVNYQVRPGELFHLDTVRYQMFPMEADSLIRVNMHGTLLRQGEPFSVKNLDGERTRLSNVFRNNGYYYFRPEYIAYLADTLMREQYVQLRVQPSAEMPQNARRQYYIGKTRVEMYDYEATALRDSMGRRNIKLVHSGEPGKSPLKMGAMRRYLTYRRGDLFSQQNHEVMQEKLAGMGVFSQLAVRYVPRDTTEMCDTLDVEIMARLDKPYDAEFKGNVATKSNGLVGPGVSFSMSKINAFRGAETLSFEAYGSYEWQTGAQIEGKRNVINSYEYGASLNLVYPRLTMLGLAKKLNRRAVTSTTYRIEANWLNRSSYFGRVSFGARLAYSYKRKPTISHELVPFRLDYDMQLHSTARFDSIINANQALYVSMRDQFVPSMQYTLAMRSRNDARNPRTLVLSLKEAGNVTSGVYRAFGQSWKQTNKNLFGVPFAQYFKATLEMTDKIKIGSTRTELCGRLFAGAVVSYGNSTLAPYSDLFAVGGANSIRAFGIRTIGPGSYHPAKSNYSYIDQMGDLKIEANIEYRFPLVASLYGALFVDAGNVWLMEQNDSHPGASFNIHTLGREIALGTGAGLRYDLDFLVIRFDVGVGIHAPYDTGKSGYYNMIKFGKSLGYHLAIGYPF